MLRNRRVPQIDLNHKKLPKVNGKKDKFFESQNEIVVTQEIVPSLNHDAVAGGSGDGRCKNQKFRKLNKLNFVAKPTDNIGDGVVRTKKKREQQYEKKSTRSVGNGQTRNKKSNAEMNEDLNKTLNESEISEENRIAEYDNFDQPKSPTPGENDVGYDEDFDYENLECQENKLNGDQPESPIQNQENQDQDYFEDTEYENSQENFIMDVLKGFNKDIGTLYSKTNAIELGLKEIKGMLEDRPIRAPISPRIKRKSAFFLLPKLPLLKRSHVRKMESDINVIEEFKEQLVRNLYLNSLN